jgi:methylated-DNA-[protein]-cysteine S-methyltransferase
MKYYYSYASPIGSLHLISDGTSLIGLDFYPSVIRPGDEIVESLSVEPFPETVRQLDEYFQGHLRQFDLPIRLDGTDFQIRAWTALTGIPFGQTLSYKGQADRIGSVPRAVGMANGQNPIPVIIPCHRVIGADGKLVGFGGGLPRKRALLQFEALVCDFGQQPMAPIPGL